MTARQYLTPFMYFRKLKASCPVGKSSASLHKASAFPSPQHLLAVRPVGTGVGSDRLSRGSTLRPGVAAMTVETPNHETEGIDTLVRAVAERFGALPRVT